jgi:serine/threonine-protein kinase
MAVAVRDRSGKTPGAAGRGRPAWYLQGVATPFQGEPATAKLGEFEIEGVLGRGGSGAVYAAWDGSGRQVALKVLHADLALSEHERQRFMEEAQRMRRVSHEGLVALAGSGELPDGRPYICMPRLHGETLSTRLRGGRLPIADALAIFDALASALAALHDAGLLHRDIKPSNVFLVVTEGAPRPVLLDFGIARDVGDPTGTTTAAGRVRGTPAYMAPERLFGTGATVQSDVYELAITLYLMLVGRRPWERDHDAESRLNPKPPEALGVELPGALSTCLLQALSTRPELRPHGARAFADAVRESVSVEGPSARQTVTLDVVPQLAVPEATTERMVPARRRPRLLVAAVACAAAAALIGQFAIRSRAATLPAAIAPEPFAAPRVAAAPSPPIDAPIGVASAAVGPTTPDAIPPVTPGPSSVTRAPSAAPRGPSRPFTAGARPTPNIYSYRK